MSEDFYNSLRASAASFIEAVARDIETGNSDALLSMERTYEEGFMDGMRHAYVLLTGTFADGLTASEIERTIRANEVSPELRDICAHQNGTHYVPINYETGWRVCDTCGNQERITA